MRIKIIANFFLFFFSNAKAQSSLNSIAYLRESSGIYSLIVTKENNTVCKNNYSTSL